MKWWLQCFKKYSDFSGRARRKEYWYFTLFNLIIAVVLTIIGGAIINIVAGASNSLGAASVGSYSYLGFLIYMVYALVALIPGIAVVVRRLHDTGRGGGWYFIVLIPYIGAIWLLVLMCLNGEPNENRFGANPKA